MQPDFAFYYPGQRFKNVNWIKNLICFFDGIAMLIPEEMPNYLDSYAEQTVWALEDHGLFRVIHPEEVVDQQTTKALAKAFGKIIASGRLDDLASRYYGSASASSFGLLAKSKVEVATDFILANSIFQELKSRGLASDLGDDIYIAVDKVVLVLILTMLAYILEPKGEDIGIKLSPATDQKHVVNALGEILEPEFSSPAAGDIISFDMTEVGVDLGKVPMDEILDFRKQNYRQHRNYIQSVRDFARELSSIPEGERQVKYEQRQEELEDLSNDLRKISLRSWKKPITFGIGLTGAALAYQSENSIAAILSAASTTVGMMSDKPKEVNVYSYLFSAKRRF